MSNWLQMHIHTCCEHVEAIEHLLMSFDALAITFQDEGNQPILEPDLGSMPLWQQVRLTALFDANTQADQLLRQLREQAPSNSITQLQHEQLADQAWERAWLIDFRPITINDRLLIVPTNWPTDPSSLTHLILDPGLAFGTGSHPTTHMCLHWLTEQDLTDKIVIDYGCGSGILAIAAAILGARQVYAIDIDPQALTATRDNAEKNQVSDRIAALSSDQWQTSPHTADVLIANILAGPLASLKNAFVRDTVNNSRIALAGLLNTQAAELITVYRPQFHLSVQQNKQEWSLLAGYRLS
jgi:ribosomal protein L11 methyltransferase